MATHHARGMERFLKRLKSGPTSRPAKMPATVMTVEAVADSAVPPKPRSATMSETLVEKSWKHSTKTKLMNVMSATSRGIDFRTLPPFGLGSRWPLGRQTNSTMMKGSSAA